MEHQWYEYGDGHHCSEWGECNLCVLACCKVCGLVEGALTTDCPGTIVGFERSDEIYGGLVDYREDEGGWVNKLNPTNQSWLKGAISDQIQGRNNAMSDANIRMKFRVSVEEFNVAKSEVLKSIMTYAEREAARVREFEEKQKQAKRRHLELIK